MYRQLIHIDPNSSDSLQQQIRQKLVEGILIGAIEPNQKLPSSRRLAQELQVSRNTIVLVYQTLKDEGYLVTRERSGIFVNDQLKQGSLLSVAKESELITKTTKRLSKSKFSGAVALTGNGSAASNWQEFPYPFIDGKYDTELYPTKEWREALLKASTSSEIYQWSSTQGLEDDPLLLDEIRNKILPRRGIQAGRNEILITSGSQQALFLLCELLVSSRSRVAVEEPGYPEIRQLIQRKGAGMRHQTVDAQGMVIDDDLADCDLVYCTPSHQTPTSVTMSMARRDQLLSQAHQQDFLIVEDDFEFESNFLGQPHPALRSLDSHNRVVYLSCLSKVLVAGVQIGFIVAAPQVIDELKKLRKLIARHPPLLNQRAVAYFLALGHYDAYMMQLHKTFFERWLTLREALNIYLPDSIDTGPIEGGTAYWIVGPEQLDGEHLREQASAQGILIEPVKRYFSSPTYPTNCFRMGVTSIREQNIREGVRKLAKLIFELTSKYDEKLSNAKGKLLSHQELQSLLPNSTLKCQMVYGVSCTIELLEDGTMLGRTSGKGKEEDVGKWWIEDGRYYRQWQLWGYAEVGSFYVIKDGSEIKWFDENYRLIRQLEFYGAGLETAKSADEET
ncbi:PLP-dependent aminotransferase family protein [Paraferrimonas haliotis]|uniref:GntR family transcriptional regulator n=1 Tax=Paraferrimonas haliotis TaxID=2013866 RepID=A0AA37TM14_9GAMM|nr:PLP-dependent aminotransferase family protein [Paraferrimonas haliotis]GLS83849.1 GntR family transcriptional regulator [Paraferrimonas haliotis]GLS83976.1 GntR family transcriptional regulator [Paraferrimonas haliotis]